MSKRVRKPKVKGVFSTKEFCLDFELLNYRDVCFQCVFDLYSFDEKPCSECQILRPSHFQMKRRSRTKGTK